MRHTRTEKMNHDHFAKVIVARNRFNDVEDAKVIQYMDRAVAQADAQINRPSMDVANKVNKTFKQRFMEAL
jgi:hypothetical protein